MTDSTVDPDWFREAPRVVEREEVPEVDTSFQVRIRQLTIHPHPGADMLELAQVDGFRAVVRKGEFKTGDYALYIPEKAILPDDLLQEIGLWGKLSGSGKNRVKPMKLRGQLSEGIVCRPAAIEAQFAVPALAWTWTTEEVDYAELLGIIKWQAKVPAAFAGKIKQRGPSRILPWINIENIKKVPWLFRPGDLVIATEKVHGTHLMCTLDFAGGVEGGEFMLSSKGMGKQGWDLVEDEGNLYWKAARKWQLEEWLREAVQFFKIFNPQRLAIYGEVYGEGVQDLGYGENVGYRLFDIRVDDTWVSQYIVQSLAKTLAGPGWDFPVRAVPVVYDGLYDYDALEALASGTTIVGGGKHIREGIVVRHAHERTREDGSRVIAKFISPEYLLRKGETTEFE